MDIEQPSIVEKKEVGKKEGKKLAFFKSRPEYEPSYARRCDDTKKVKTVKTRIEYAPSYVPSDIPYDNVPPDVSVSDVPPTDVSPGAYAVPGIYFTEENESNSFLNENPASNTLDHAMYDENIVEAFKVNDENEINTQVNQLIERTNDLEARLHRRNDDLQKAEIVKIETEKEVTGYTRKTKISLCIIIILIITAIVFAIAFFSRQTETPMETPSLVPSETPSLAPTDIPSDIPSDTPTETPSQIPTEIPTEIPTQGTCGNGICDASGGVQKTCSSCPQDCSFLQDCNSVGEFKNGSIINKDWYGVSFKVNAIKNVSFYEFEIETSSLGEDIFEAKLYTREGTYDRYEGMAQWTNVFEDYIYSMPGEFRVTIPIVNPLFTEMGTERSFYLSFSKGQTIVFHSYYERLRVASENEFVQLFTGEGQNSTFGKGLGNYVEMSALLSFTTV